jgi:hypothetical protein
MTKLEVINLLAVLQAMKANIREDGPEDEAAWEWAGHIQHVIDQVKAGKMDGQQAHDSLGGLDWSLIRDACDLKDDDWDYSDLGSPYEY